MSQKEVEQLKSDFKTIEQRLSSIEDTNAEDRNMLQTILKNVTEINAKIDFMGLALHSLEKSDMIPKKQQKRTTGKGRKPAIDEGTDDSRPEIKTPAIINITTPTMAAIVTPGVPQMYDNESELGEHDDEQRDINGDKEDHRSEISEDDQSTSIPLRLNYMGSSIGANGINGSIGSNQNYVAVETKNPPKAEPPKKKYNKMNQFKKIFKQDPDFIYKYLPVGVKSELDKDKSLINLQGDKLTQARSTVFYNWMSTNPAKVGKFFEELAKK